MSKTHQVLNAYNCQVNSYNKQLYRSLAFTTTLMEVMARNERYVCQQKLSTLLGHKNFLKRSMICTII